MTKLELLELIQNGENSFVEFKRDDRTNKNYSEHFAKEMVAFSNGRGGKIIVGVEDDRSVTGLIKEGFEEWVMNVARTLVHPVIIPFYEEINYDELRKIAIVHVDMGYTKPYATERGERRTYYVRVGSTSREATKEELARLFQSSGAFHYDVAPVPSSSLEVLDYEKLANYFKKYRDKDFDDLTPSEIKSLLINSEILKKTEYGEVATVGGLLIFGKEPYRFLPQSGITFAYFEGTEVTEKYFERIDIEGTVTQLIDETVRLIQRNIPRIARIKGLEREEITIPREVLREAVTNAVAHRDYTILGAKVRVYVFFNRIEIRSPGSLPNTVTIEKMEVGGVSVARNPFIVNYLVEFKYVERLGRGVLSILQNMERLGAPEPLLKEEGEEFIFTIYYPDIKRENNK